MASTNEILTRLVADTKQFDGAMNGTIKIMERFNKKGELIGQSVQVMTKHMKDGAVKTNDFGKAMTALSRDIKVAGTIFHTLSAAISGAYEAASEGAKIMAAEQFFTNAGKSIESYRKATSGMVSDAELMKKANLADSMGIGEDTFKKLVMVAEASALKTGQSFDYMFNSIIVGTARSSRLLLDNLGIIVSVKQANEKYAASIGKVVEDLSAEEKQLAFVNEVALKSQGTLDEYANTTDRTAEAYARLGAAAENVANTLKTTMAKVFADAAKDSSTFLNDLNTILGGSVRAVEDASPLMAKAAQSFWDGFMAPLTVLKKAYITPIKEAMSGAADLIRGYEDKKKKEQEDVAVSFTMEYATQLQEELGNDWQKAVQTYVEDGTSGLGAALDDTIQLFLEFNATAKENFGKFKARPVVDTAPTLAQAGKQKKAPEQKAFGDTKFFSLMNAMDDVIKDFASRDFAKKGVGLMAPLFSSGFLTNLDAGEKGIDRQRKRIDEINELLSEEAKLRREAINQAAGDATTSILTGGGLIAPLMEALTAGGGGVAKSVGSAISSLISGTAEGAAGGPMGAIIGAVVAVLMQLLDQLKPIMDIIDAIMAGLELLLKNGFAEFLKSLSALAEPIEHILASIGLLVGAILRPFTWILVGMVAIVAGVIDAVAWIIALISPFVEMVVWLIVSVFTFGMGLISLFMDIDGAVQNVMNAMWGFGRAIVNSVIGINNAIVRFARETLKMEGFGKILKKEDFKKSPIDENTNAVNANTQAVRDLTREFRNLPSGYKAEGAIYASQASDYGRMRRDAIGLASSVGLVNSRWRT